MTKITMKIDGMMCGMCESHMNSAIRNVFSVKKVTSSHKSGETVILTDTDIDEAQLKETVGQTGYVLKSITKEPYEKQGIFSFFKK